jgi:hypothetical protein
MNSVMPGVAAMTQAKTPSKVSPMPKRPIPVIQRVVAPQVKLFMRCDSATWLFAELDYDDVAFGLCDLGQDSLQFGYGPVERAAK